MLAKAGKYRKGKLTVSVRGFPKRTVEYYISRSPSAVLGGLVHFCFPGRKREFFGNVRPGISRGNLMNYAKTYVQQKLGIR